jgi:hypothetical protein
VPGRVKPARFFLASGWILSKIIFSASRNKYFAPSQLVPDQPFIALRTNDALSRLETNYTGLAPAVSYIGNLTGVIAIPAIVGSRLS